MILPRVLLALAAASLALDTRASPPEPLPDGIYAEFDTPRGVVVAELHYRQAPLTVANFVGLAEGFLGPKPGRPFFNGLTFHRVVPDFVVQGGDPLGTGEGGPGYVFPDEFTPGLHHDAAGVLSMANDGPDTNGSQFFFTLREVNRLNYLHSVFGRVVRGADVLPRLRMGDTMTTVTIRRVGADALAFRTDRAAFDALAAKARKFQGRPTPGPAAHFDDPDHLLPAEPPRALAFQRKLANFERATGGRIYARALSRFTPETPSQNQGAYVEALARKLGLPADSALAVCFADTGHWALWFGDGYLPRFTGRSGKEAAQMKSGRLQQSNRDLLEDATARAEAVAADFARHNPTRPSPTRAERLKFQVDAVLDALIFKFEPILQP